MWVLMFLNYTVSGFGKGNIARQKRVLCPVQISDNMMSWYHKSPERLGDMWTWSWPRLLHSGVLDAQEIPAGARGDLREILDGCESTWARSMLLSYFVFNNSLSQGNFFSFFVCVRWGNYVELLKTSFPHTISCLRYFYKSRHLLSPGLQWKPCYRILWNKSWAHTMGQWKQVFSTPLLSGKASSLWAAVVKDAFQLTGKLKVPLTPISGNSCSPITLFPSPSCANFLCFPLYIKFLAFILVKTIYKKGLTCTHYYI